MPDRVEFYLDGMLTFILTDDIPDSPGHLLLSHWSNGNMGWSMGPPKEDAVLTISYFKAYFNTTEGNGKSGCSDANEAGAVCLIPNQINPPDPSSGQTPFFTLPNGTTNTPASPISSVPGSTGSAVASTGGRTTMAKGSRWQSCGLVVVLAFLGAIVARH